MINDAFISSFIKVNCAIVVHFPPNIINSYSEMMLLLKWYFNPIYFHINVTRYMFVSCM